MPEAVPTRSVEDVSEVVSEVTVWLRSEKNTHTKTKGK